MAIPMSMEATVDRFEGDSAILRLADGQEVFWPLDQIPDDCEEGSMVSLALIAGPDALEDRRGPSAEDVLNEIFNSEEE